MVGKGPGVMEQQQQAPAKQPTVTLAEPVVALVAALDLTL
uniref:Uncharacterized protein n=1 Tax=viral metagenome TaxID=1070528 RepID=A0A6H1ZV07_9ZZZZ